MKKTLMMAAALVVLAGCGEKKTAGAGDTTGMSTTPADTGMAGMSHDSAMPMSDTTMARDTTKK